MKSVVCLTAVLLLTACGGGNGGSDTLPIAEPEPPASGLLVPVTSDSQLLDSVRSGFEQEISRAADVAVDLEGGPAPAASGGAFTTTYTLETSVDEHDIVKYDGRHLYIAPSRGMYCCFIVEPELSDPDITAPALPDPVPASRDIRILATDAETAQAVQVGAIELDADRTVEGLYVQSERLAVITSSAWWGYYGPAFARAESWADQTSGLHLYDVSSAATPSTLLDVEVEGGFVTSRMVGDTVYLVTRHFPTVDGLDIYPVDEAGREQAEQRLQSLSVADILPRLRVNGEQQALITASDCVVEDPNHEFAPPEPGYPVLTAIIAIDLASAAVTDTLCYAGDASGVYVSGNAIYITQEDYSGLDDPQTLVHRFDYREGLGYRGSGRVRGSLYGNASPDFRISESSTYLRLVTSVWTGSRQDLVEHYLYVLQPAGDAPELEVVATLPNASRPQAIGKPNEDLYGVRFLGDRAYLVTFERTDPLYVIDLSDHLDPHIAGELEVTGFSDFLHPVSDSLLLGLGQDEGGHVKLELFDVSRLAQPVSRGALVLSADAQWIYSPARYDRHAFTYLAGSDGVDRFTVPVSAEFYDEVSGYSVQQRLHLLEVRGRTEPATAGLADRGYIAAQPPQEAPSDSYRSRAILHGDAVFFINGDYVWSALWDEPFNAVGPQ
jgi:uncharacterized secreted protein with C-terminal beta-propeller domain